MVIVAVGPLGAWALWTTNVPVGLTGDPSTWAPDQVPVTRIECPGARVSRVRNMGTATP